MQDPFIEMEKRLDALRDESARERSDRLRAIADLDQARAWAKAWKRAAKVERSDRQLLARATNDIISRENIIAAERDKALEALRELVNAYCRAEYSASNVTRPMLWAKARAVLEDSC